MARHVLIQMKLFKDRGHHYLKEKIIDFTSQLVIVPISCMIRSKPSKTRFRLDQFFPSILPRLPHPKLDLNDSDFSIQRFAVFGEGGIQRRTNA